jgi:hypothetical protein
VYREKERRESTYDFPIMLYSDLVCSRKLSRQPTPRLLGKGIVRNGKKIRARKRLFVEGEDLWWREPKLSLYGNFG